MLPAPREGVLRTTREGVLRTTREGVLRTTREGVPRTAAVMAADMITDIMMTRFAATLVRARVGASP